MIPFDGKFAQDYALPLAAAAYNEPWNNPWGDSVPDPTLAHFTEVQEILVDTNPIAPRFAFGHPAIPPTTHNLMHAMTLPKGAGVAPAGVDILAAEGGAKAPADADAPLPPTLGPTAVAPKVLAPAVPIDGRFGWMARDGKRLVVAFRGTQTPADWLKNFDFVPAPYLPIPGRGTVHQGFQLVYYAVRDNILKYIKATAPGVTELLVVGHSLGGAIAALAIPDLLAQLPGDVAPILYTFAGPRAGHRDFEKFFDGRINVAWRVVNVWDVVPHVPPLLAGYVHVGQQLTIDSGFHVDVAANHVLRTGYRPGIEAWNLHHPVPVSAPPPASGTPSFVSSLHGLTALAGVSD